MKRNFLKLSFIFFSFFLVNSATAQNTENMDVKESTIETKMIDGHEVMFFNSEQEKNAWIADHPEEYAQKLEEAEQVSATFIGTLLQVKQPVNVKRNKIPTTPQSK